MLFWEAAAFDASYINYLGFFDTLLLVTVNTFIPNNKKRNRERKRSMMKIKLRILVVSSSGEDIFSEEFVGNFFFFSLFCSNLQQILINTRKISWKFTFPEILLTIPRNICNILRNLLEIFPESFLTFPRIFSNISRNVLEHSPEYF